MLEACDETVGTMEEDMLRELDQDERDALYHGLVSSVRALHAGLPDS